MNYIDMTRTPQVLYFTRGGFTPTAAPTLSAENTTDHATAAFTVSSCEVRGYLLRLAVAIPQDVYPGEWELTLTIPVGTSTVALKGLAIITDGETPGVEYNREITCKQYGE